MTDLDPATAAAADFYDKHYAASEPIMLSPGMPKLTLGNPQQPRRCRFCGKSEPEVTFKDDAHALPAAFVKSGLHSHYECDACNHLFGEGIENQLGNWSKPLRTLSRIKGRNGVPTIKQPGPDKGWRIEYSETTGFDLKEYEDNPVFTVDEEAKQLRFELHRDTYIPVAVLKVLVKIGLTLLPDDETQHFTEAFQWIRDPDHSKPFLSQFPVLRTFIPGPMPNDLMMLMILRRRRTVTNVPYAFYVLGFGNIVLQVFLPSPSQDQSINGQTLDLRPFPTPALEGFGRPRTSSETLTGHQPVKGEKMPVIFGFDSVSKVELNTGNP